MSEYVTYIKKTIIKLFIWCLVVSSILVLTAEVNNIVGFILGSVASILYFLLMAYRIKNSAEMPVDKAVNYMRIGWLLRLTFLIITLILSVKMPQVNFLFAILGVFSLQIVLTINSVMVVVKATIINKLN